VPSKLFDFCAVGRPVVVAAAGESRDLAEAAGAALGVPAGDPRALASALLRLREDRELRDRIATAGREFGSANLRDRHVDRFSSLLESVAMSSPARP
jgi:glycosyltransferase involved in cell wall biosynthesis